MLNSFNPRIISVRTAIDTSKWDESKLKEYQRLMEKDKKEAIDNYYLACKQLNALLASSGVMLSIIISAILSLSFSPSLLIFVISSCFIASSIVLSAYASLKSRRIVSIYSYDNTSLTAPDDYNLVIVASINVTIRITESHYKASELKRTMLNCSLLLFIIGILVSVSGIVAYCV